MLSGEGGGGDEIMNRNCTNPYLNEGGPYSKKANPYSKKTSPYSKKISPYSEAESPYSKKMICDYFLLTEDESPILQENGGKIIILRK